MDLVGRWRKGREAKREAERELSSGRLPRIGAIHVKAPSNEQAAELVDVLRKHGIPAELPRAHGKRVEIGEPESGDRSAVLRAVELWLLLPSSPDEVDVRCGRRRLAVRRPDEQLEPSNAPVS